MLSYTGIRGLSGSAPSDGTSLTFMLDCHAGTGLGSVQ